MVVVEMKKPFGVLFNSYPTRNQILETIKDLIAMKDKELDDCFEIHYFDITDGIEGTIAERT